MTNAYDDGPRDHAFAAKVANALDAVTGAGVEIVPTVRAGGWRVQWRGGPDETRMRELIHTIMDTLRAPHQSPLWLIGYDRQLINHAQIAHKLTTTVPNYPYTRDDAIRVLRDIDEQHGWRGIQAHLAAHNVGTVYG